jgi:4-amino-4-deoxy-L-arabinose transferase-like glycosyltransferase
LSTSTLAKRLWLLLFLAIAGFYFYGLGALPLVGPDEPRYAEVAREMLERRDFITPTLGGVPWFEKPPLLYWMMMASFRVFGVNEYAARFGPALCGLITATFTWWVARSFEGTKARRRGPQPGSPAGVGMSGKVRNHDSSTSEFAGLLLWSPLVFLSSLGAIGFSRGASFDIVLTMTVTGALSCFLVWHLRSVTSTSSPDASPELLAGFYFFVGLSLLAKGLVGVILPFGVLTLYFIVRREWPNRIFIKSLLWGIPIAFTLAGVWYVPMISRHGSIFVDQFVIQHHFARFLSNKYHHPQPFYFYLPVLALLVLPWTVVLVAAITSARTVAWRAGTAVDRLRVFAIIWIAAPLIFFSFSGSKIPGYLLPVLPAAALLVGERINCFLRANRGERIIRSTAGLIIIAAGIGSWYSVQNLGVSVSWVIAGLLVALLMAGVALIDSRPRSLSFLLVGLTPFVLAAIALRPAMSVAQGESVRDLIRAADARGYASTPVFYMLSNDRTAEFYAGGRLAYQPNGEPFRFDGAHELAAAVRQKGGIALVIIESRWEKQLTDYSVVRTEKIGSNGWLTLFVVRVG